MPFLLSLSPEPFFSSSTVSTAQPGFSSGCSRIMTEKNCGGVEVISAAAFVKALPALSSGLF